MYFRKLFSVSTFLVISANGYAEQWKCSTNYQEGAGETCDAAQWELYGKLLNVVDDNALHMSTANRTVG